MRDGELIVLFTLSRLKRCYLGNALVFCCLAALLSCQVRQVEDHPPALAASFTYSPNLPIVRQSVQFTDASEGNPNSWQWIFGDGGTSTSRNPSHTYGAAGSYVVTLTVQSDSNTDSASRTVTVLPEAEGTVYYVDTGHPSASDSNPGTEALPWKTITKANQTLVAGDTVYIKAGAYTTYIAPARSGTASDRITYRAYGTEVVTVRDASYAILLDGKSYITVEGVNFYNLDRFMYLRNGANHNIVAYCNFDQVRNRLEWGGSKIIYSSSHNWIHHCRFSKYGSYDTNARGSVLDIGNEESTTDISNYNLFENNTAFHGGHHVLGVYGAYNVIRNNYFHNENWLDDHGERNIMLAGYPNNSGHNLIEGNRVGYSGYPPANAATSGMALCTGYNIVRRNEFCYNNGAGLGVGTASGYYSDVVYNKIYGNTFLHNGFNASAGTEYRSAIGFVNYGSSHIVKYNAVKNNLYYDHYQAYGYYSVNAGDQVFANNWNGDTQGNPLFMNATGALGDPMDASYPDMHLSLGSPCIDAGGALTTIASSSGAGTAFVVTDAGYFMDGWGIEGVLGDEIQIVGTSQKARITRVDYGTNTITVSSSLTWTLGQGISLAYAGSAPDAGAHEDGITLLLK
jgi:PKD repeat protein